jgi:hypothetical protein
MEKSFFAKILYNYPVLFVGGIPVSALARLAIGIAFIAGESKNVSDLSVSTCQRAMERYCRKAATEIKELIIDQRKWGKDQILSFFLAFDKF